MDNISRAQNTAGCGSGGKIVRRRQKTASRTPYDRPPPPSSLPENNSSNNNWLTGATRLIASGATKIFSFMADTNSTSSSSDSEDGASSDDVGYDIASKIDKSKEDGTSLEMFKSFRKEPQLLIEKSESKWVIEQLLLQETFTREESDKLTEIIKSRVVDCSTMDDGLVEIPSGRFRDTTPDLRNKALMEAKNWLEEKKVGSSSKSDLDQGISGFSSVALHHLTKHEVGSPVDMAKSYMQARPPWASPSLGHTGSRTPSPMPMDLFKEETPFSVGGNSFSSSQKRDTLAGGSWNIQEEIRRVRSKATEDMLRTIPSTRMDISSFSLGPKSYQNSSAPDKIIIGGNGDRIHLSNSLAAYEPHDGVKGSSALGVTQDSSQVELLSSNPPTSFSEPNQDPKPNQIDEEGGITDSHHSISPKLLSNQHDENNARSGDRNISTKEVGKISEAPNANGSASSKPSLSAGMNSEKNPPESDEKNNLNPVSSIKDKLTSSSIPAEEEICGFLSETAVEVPLVSEFDIVIPSGSQNSSSAHFEESGHENQVDLTQGGMEAAAAGHTGSSVDEKQQQGKRQSRYQRKGRGRGK